MNILRIFIRFIVVYTIIFYFILFVGFCFILSGCADIKGGQAIQTDSDANEAACLDSGGVPFVMSSMPGTRGDMVCGKGGIDDRTLS